MRDSTLLPVAIPDSEAVCDAIDSCSTRQSLGAVGSQGGPWEPVAPMAPGVFLKPPDPNPLNRYDSGTRKQGSHHAPRDVSGGRMDNPLDFAHVAERDGYNPP